MSFFDDAISTIGKGLAQTAAKELSDATGYDIGGTLNFLFGNNQTTGGEDLANITSNLPQNYNGSPDQLNFLQETLSQQGQMIVDLGGQLTSISQSINEITLEIDQIEDLLQELKNQQLFSQWQAVDNEIIVYSNAINSAYKTYSNYIENYLTTQSSEVEDLKTDILNVNNGPIVGMNGISTFILDDGMQKGALQLWSNMVSALVQAGVMDYRDAANQYMGYYQKLVFAQLTATNLVMEAYNMSDDSNSANAFYASYKKVVLSQEQTFINWLIPILNAGVVGGMATSQSYVQPALDASLQINPNFSALKNYTEYYSPSQIFYDAESMLSSLYNTDIADRRIVTYMLYTSDPTMQNLLQNVNITLVSTDNQFVVQPASFNTFGPFPFPPTNMSSYQLPDPNFDGAEGYYIKRFIYLANEDSTSLADTSYNLTNLNGTGNLVPIGTYSSTFYNSGNYGSEAPFMTKSITNYVLSVDETTNFDFMNFVAYNYPSPQVYTGQYIN